MYTRLDSIEFQKRPDLQHEINIDDLCRAKCRAVVPDLAFWVALFHLLEPIDRASLFAAGVDCLQRNDVVYAAGWPDDNA